MSSALYFCVIMLGTYLSGAVGASERAGCRRLVVLRLAVVGVLLRTVVGPGGAGAGGSDPQMLQDLAASKALIVEPNDGKVVAIRVPLSLLPGVVGSWYLPCSKGQLPESVITTLHADDEYQLPGFSGRFSVKWCHHEWNHLLRLERETSRGTNKYIALAHRLFHALPRTQRLPTYYDADFTRFRPIAEATFPLRGYPLMGPAGSGHGMEERHPPLAVRCPPTA